MRRGLLPLFLLATVLSQSALHAGIDDCDTTLRDINITSSLRPAIVWNGSDHGIAWTRIIAGNDEIMFARVNAAGHLIGGEVQVTQPPGDSIHVDLVWNGNGYGVVWQDDRDGSNAIYFTRLSTTGVKLIGDVRISPLPNSSNLPSLVWTGSEYGVAWYDAAGWDTIYFTRLDSFGNEIGSEIAVSPAANVNSFAPSLAWNGSSYGLLWTEGNSKLGFARLEGQVVTSIALTDTGSGPQSYTDLVWDGFGYGAVWNKANKTYFVRLTASGFAISPQFVVGAAASGTPPAVDWNGSEYAVAYSNNEMALNRRSAFGSLIGEDVVVLPGSSTGWFGVVWNGSSYRVVADNQLRIKVADFVCSCDPTDDDGDGFSRCEGECDDSDASTYPGAAELCDGNDNGCTDNVPTGEIDDDGDGYVECDGWDDTQGDQPSVIGSGDCDDSKNNIFPGALEICDRLDTDCDGIKDLGDPDLVNTRDSDQDTLLDCWELYGIDVDEPDLICRAASADECDLPLHMAPFNANPVRGDIYIEVDYMDCATGGCDPSHASPTSHAPTSGALGLISEAFGRRGITAHFIGGDGFLDEAIPEIEPMIFGPNSGAGAADDFWDLKWGSSVVQDPCAPGSDAHFGTVADRLSDNCVDRIDAKRRVFHYAIFGHASPQGWGTSEIFGNDILIGVGTAESQRAIHTIGEQWSKGFDIEAAEAEAGILMHALGHSLGFGHGGVDGSGSATDTPECRPNHMSVMNFARTWNGAGTVVDVPGQVDGVTIRTARDLDFARQQFNDPVDLDELALVETIDIAEFSPLFIFGDGAGNPYVTRADASIDWNLDGSISGGAVQRDINFIDFGTGSSACPPSPGQILEQHDEWEAIQLALPLSATVIDTPPLLPAAGEFDFPTVEPATSEYLNGGLGTIDADGDGIENTSDVCPLVDDPVQDDLDGDGYGDVCDCLPNNSQTWGKPSDPRRLRLPDHINLTWEDPTYPGTSSFLIFDVLRSDDHRNFTTATCIESNGTDRVATDVTLPAAGELLFYLIRAESVCPDGLGTLGNDTVPFGNYERSAPDCN